MAVSKTVSITGLLESATRGDREAQEQLWSCVYDELRRLAASFMRQERRQHTLQPTALVHEAYFRLIDQKRAHYRNRAHFFGVAAQLMRLILVDSARAAAAEKRGGGAQRLGLEEAVAEAFDEPFDIDLLALDEALRRLEESDARQCRIVELRFFGGLSIEETAQALGISPATVKREWDFTKAWLYKELSPAR